MKKLALALFFGGVFCSEAIGQTEKIEDLYLPKVDGKVIYQKVLDLKGVPAKEIYRRANFWIFFSVSRSQKIG